MRFQRSKWVAASALVALVAVVTWLSVLARTGDVPTYTSYASGDFFFPPYTSDADRMGIAAPNTALYNPALQAGWYYDWDANPNPPHPGSAEYARLIGFTVNTNACGLYKIPASQRSQVVESITGTALIDNLRANPGALWLIGNEPDSIYNCGPIIPELYAELYHEFYTFIKTYDPSARVAIAGIVQPSPLRLEYLDKVLNHYQLLYGQKLPTALWNIHDYAFREVAGSYGAGVPPGASSNVGWTYDLLQWMDVNLWVQNLRAMRQWMADRGERDKPLIITEFGQVVPDGYCWSGFCYTPQVSRDTLQASISRFLTETDALVGYPADGNRLVQFWAWYPLYDSYYGGDLVNTDGSLTLAGTAFSQIATQHFVPRADLYPVPLITPTIPAGNSEPVVVTLTVQLDNHGNAEAQSVPVRFAQYDYASGQLLTSDLITISQVFTRYGGTQPIVSNQWTLVPGTAYTLTFEIDPAQTISQTRRSPQRLSYALGHPDLSVISLTTDYPMVSYWDKPVTWTFTATIKNLGDGTSPPSALQLSGAIAGGTTVLGQDVPVPTLAAGASATVSGTLVLPFPGNYTIAATVQYTTPNQGVRSHTFTMHVGEPDLAVTALASDYVSGSAWYGPVTPTFTVTARNVGYTTSPTGVVRLSLSNTTMGTLYLGQDIALTPLVPNASVAITGLLMIPTYGSYVITATVQPAGLDLNEQNDSTTLSILVAAHQLYLPLVFHAGP